MRLAARLAALALLAGCAIAPAAGASSSSHGDRDGKAGTGFSVDRSAASSLNLTSLLVAPAAAASSSPQIQYLGDTAGTSFAFSLRNTGVTSIGALQVARPTASWTIIDCPTAPAGWSVTRSDKTCRYRSAAGTADDLPIGQTWTTFEATATTLGSTLNGKGAWKLLVSSTESFSDPLNLASASSEAPGLGVFTYSFQVLDAGVVASAPAAGDPCPSLTKNATAGSAKTLVICGRNRTSAAATPVVPPTALAGSFLQGAGSFSSGSIAPSGPASASVVLGIWTGAEVDSSTGSGKDLIVDIGSASTTTSPQTTLGGFTVGPANAAPTDIQLSNTSVAENQPSGTNVGSFSTTDPDAGDTHTYSLVSGTGDADNGSFQISGNTLQTNAVFDFETKSSYSIRIRTTDSGNASFEKQFTITVTDVAGDVPPTAVDDSATVGEDSGASAIDVLVNDTDPDGGPKTISSASDPANGTVVLTGGPPATGLTYQPDPNYCNNPPGTTPDTFTYTLNGGSTATVSVTVTCVDDPPTAVDDSATVPEDSGASAIDVLVNDTNPDGGPKTISSASDPANGTVVLTGGPPATGLTYQPDPNYCNNPPGTTPDTFTYTLNGGSTATVSVTVTCAPDNPVVDTSAGSTSYTENAAATVIDAALTVSDPDAGTTITAATIKITGNYAGAEDVLALAGSHPGIAPSLAGDTLTLTGNASVAAYQSALRDVTYSNGSDNPSTLPRTVTFTVTDDTSRSGSDTKGITVSAVDDPPTAVNDSATVLEDAAATAISVLTNDTDVDGGAKTISSASDPANGTVVLTGGSPGAHTGLTYQPDPNYCNDPPGTTKDTFTYTLNGGSTATVSMTVTCVNDAPVAGNDSFNSPNHAIGNTTLIVNDPGDGAPTVTGPAKTISGTIRSNDTDIDGPGPLVVVAGTVASADGGSVTLEADGDFTFRPKAATSCTDNSDSFSYTISDQNSPTPGTATGTVTIAIQDCIWYVKNDFGGAADGRSETPFTTLAAADAAATTTGATIFVFRGTGSAGLTDTVDLLASQRLLGEAVSLVSGATTLVTGNPANRPPLTGTINLAAGNTISGIAMAGSGAPAIAGAAGDASGTIADVQLSGASGGLDLNAATGTYNISDLSVSTTGGDAIHTVGAGALTVNFTAAGTISVTAAAGRGLNLATTATSGTIDSTTVTSSANEGIKIDDDTGSLTLDDLNLTTTGTGLDIDSSNAVTVNNSGDADISSAGTAVNLTTITSNPATMPVVSLDQVSSSGGANGINIDDIGAGAFTAVGGTLAGNTAAEIDINNGSGTITYPGTIGNGSGLSVQITGRSGGTIALAGNINDTNDAGGGIDMSTNTGGTFTFSGTTKTLNTGTGAAFSSTGSAPTINLTGGGLAITTTSGAGFAATGGGTVNVTGANNTVASTTGTALNIANTTIGASGLTFVSIASNGAANGIVLNNTGSSGGLTVTGTGSAATGGTIQNISSRGASFISARNITLNWMNFTNANTSNGAVSDGVVGGNENTDENGAIHLSSAVNVSLSDINISGTAQHGINGNNVTNLDLTNVAVNNTGDAVWESGIYLFHLKGLASAGQDSVWSNLDVTDTGQFNVSIINASGTNAAPGAKDKLTMQSGSTFANSGKNVIGDHISIFNSGTANFQVAVNTATFTSKVGGEYAGAHTSDGIQVDASGVSARFDATISGSTFGGAGVGQSAINLSATTGAGTFTVANNTGTVRQGVGINVAVTGSGSLTGTISGNTLATNITNNPSSAINMVEEGNGSIIAIVQNNTIQGSGSGIGTTTAFDYGIRGGARAGTGSAHLTIGGNTVQTAKAAGTWLFAGNNSGGETNRTCVNFSPGNTIDADYPAQAFTEYFLEQYTGTTFQIQGLSGSGTSVANVEAYVANTDLDPSPTDPNVNAGGGTIVSYSNATCSTP